MAVIEYAPTEVAATSTAAKVEKSKLRRHFGRFDILFFLVCTLVGVDTIGQISSYGAQAFTWLLVLIVLFFIPAAMLCAELGSTFPDEGGPYIWTRLAFGRLVGAVNNFMYWVTNPVWVGGTLSVSVVAAYTTFFNGGRDLGTAPFYILTLTFIWVCILAAVLSFNIGKWIPTVGAWARFGLLGGFTVTVILYASKHGVHGFGARGFSPNVAGFMLIVPLLIFNLVGFELPNSAGEEMKSAQKDVPFAIFRSAILGALLYGVPILGILIVLPTSATAGFTGFVAAIQQVFTVYGGHVSASGVPTLTGAGIVLGDTAAILFILAVITSGVTWIMGADRALAVTGYDGAGPRALGVLSQRFGTPVRVNILSGVVATSVLVLAHTLVGGSVGKLFAVVLTLAASLTLISYIGIFPALPVLRRKYPNLRRVYRAPFPLVTSGILTLLVVVSTVQILAPGLGVHWFSATFAPEGWTHSERWTYLWVEVIPLTFFLLIGVLFWALGGRTRAEARAEELAAMETLPSMEVDEGASEVLASVE